MVAPSIEAHIQVRWKKFTYFCSTFIPETVYQISSESPEFYWRYYKNILVSFFLDTVYCGFWGLLPCLIRIRLYGTLVITLAAKPANCADRSSTVITALLDCRPMSLRGTGSVSMVYQCCQFYVNSVYRWQNTDDRPRLRCTSSVCILLRGMHTSTEQSAICPAWQ